MLGSMDRGNLLGNVISSVKPLCRWLKVISTIAMNDDDDTML